MSTVASFILFSFVFYANAGKDFYYWRDFYGTIPEDAFKAVWNPDGRPTYIGQSYFSDKNHLLPTIITEGERTAFLIVSNQNWSVDKRTKILCSTNNTLFRWVPTNTSSVRYLTGCKQIEAGWSPGDIMITVGRANVQGKTLTGRVYDSSVHKLHGLYIHDSNMHEKIIPEYEVLVYDCKNPWSTDDPKKK